MIGWLRDIPSVPGSLNCMPSAGIESPTSVAMEMRELRSTWRRTIKRSDKPLARAVRT